MTRGDEVPEWAKVRACELANNVDDAAFIPEDCGFGPLLAFARYIATHEQPPEDPLLEEAKSLSTQWYDMYGRIPTDPLLAALKRGMELAKLRGNQIEGLAE